MGPERNIGIQWDRVGHGRRTKKGGKYGVRALPFPPPCAESGWGMFYGIHDLVLDDKGRTNLPKPFRELLKTQEGEPQLTALPKCLTILPAAVFEALSHKLTEASITIEWIQRWNV